MTDCAVFKHENDMCRKPQICSEAFERCKWYTKILHHWRHWSISRCTACRTWVTLVKYIWFSTFHMDCFWQFIIKQP